MLTKSQIQSIRNLHDKTGRREAGLFLVEGRKGIMEFLDSDFYIVEGFFTPDFDLPEWLTFPHAIISERELERITTLSSNRDGLLVVRMRTSPPAPLLQRGERQHSNTPTLQHPDTLTLILDGINDPGNLGTIIRTADWYGISHIICSLDTVDCYNPKVLMATMGSFTRVHVEYRDLEKYFSNLLEKGGGIRKANDGGLAISEHLKYQSSASQAQQLLSQGASLKIYGAYLDGESTHTKKFAPTWGYLVIGSESHGIREHLEQYITDKITIPRFGLAESLNAGVATAVILDRMIG